MSMFLTAGGRIRCLQCSAKSKRTGQQCRAPAIAGKTKCRFHGGKSIGPKTPEGRQRCAEARTVHGLETASMRLERSLASARLAVLESVGFGLGLMIGSRTSGRRPNHIAEAYPELQALFQKLVVGRVKQDLLVTRGNVRANAGFTEEPPKALRPREDFNDVSCPKSSTVDG